MFSKKLDFYIDYAVVSSSRLCYDPHFSTHVCMVLNSRISAFLLLNILFILSFSPKVRGFIKTKTL